MRRLEEIADQRGMPQTYIFCSYLNAEKVTSFVQSYKYGQEVTCLKQADHPILNLNGNVCLRAKDAAEVIDMPKGPAEFYHFKVGGMSLLERLKADKIEYAACCDCENILETVIDPYVLGLLDYEKEECDLMYKCAFP